MIGSEAATNRDEREEEVKEKSRPPHTHSLSQITPSSLLFSSCICAPSRFFVRHFQNQNQLIGIRWAPKYVTLVVHQAHHSDWPVTTRFEVSMSLTMSSLPFFPSFREGTGGCHFPFQGAHTIDLFGDVSRSLTRLQMGLYNFLQWQFRYGKWWLWVRFVRLLFCRGWESSKWALHLSLSSIFLSRR